MVIPVHMKRKKLNKLKINNSPYIYQRNEVKEQTTVLKTGKTDRQIQRIRAYRKQKPRCRSHRLKSILWKEHLQL